jgi:hypothetical protein
MRHDRRCGCRSASRAIDELEPTVGPEEEADADVSAGLAAALTVDRVDLPELVRRATGGGDCGDQGIPRRRCVGDAVARSCFPYESTRVNAVVAFSLKLVKL